LKIVSAWFEAFPKQVYNSLFLADCRSVKLIHPDTLQTVDVKSVVFIACRHACRARYGFTSSVRRSVRLSVCPLPLLWLNKCTYC